MNDCTANHSSNSRKHKQDSGSRTGQASFTYTALSPLLLTLLMSFHLSALAQAPSCADTQQSLSNETQHNTEVNVEAVVQQADKLIETLERNNCEKPSVSKQSDAASNTTTNYAQPDKQKAAGALDMANKHWQLRDELADDNTIQIPYFCEGTYTDYNTRQLRNAIDYEKLPIYTASDKTVMNRNSVSLFGNISITQDGYHLEAHRAKIDRESRQADLSGNVIVQSPTGAFSGDNASISLSRRSALLTNAEYILFDRQTRGSAEAISVNPEQGIRIDGGSYTLCPPNNDWWQLEADTIYLDHRKQIGSTKHARLKIKGVPVAYIPYIQFPIGDARKTGLLFPTLSNTGNGVDLTLPYYINIAPAIDATIAPRLVEERGYMTEAEIRWLNSFDRWSLSGAFLGNDKVSGEDRWVYRIRENGAYKGRLFTQLDYTEVSDNDYFDDYSLSSLSIRRQTHISQRAELSFSNRDWDISLLGQYYQTIDDATEKPFEKAPELRIRYEIDPKNNALHLGTQSILTYFESSNDLNGTRLVNDLAISYPWWQPGLFVEPKLGVSHIGYDLQSSAENSSVDVTAPFASLDTGLVFEKNNASPKPRRKITTLEPRLYYLYRPLKKQDELPLFDTTELTFGSAQLFRETRFSGHDRLDDANQLTAAITHRQIRQHNLETAATIGQIYYFTDREVNIGQALNSETDSSSDLVLQFEADINRYWYVLNSMLWDDQQGLIDEGTLSLRYRSSANDYFANGRTIGNINYHYRRGYSDNPAFDESIEQGDISLITPLWGRHWHLFAKLQYDFEQHRSIEELAGIEYSNCCVRLRTLYRDGLDGQFDGFGEPKRDRSVFLQVQLKGLVGIGNTVESLLSQAIPGYTERDRHAADNAFSF